MSSSDYGETYQKLQKEVNKFEGSEKDLPTSVGSDTKSGKFSSYLRSPYFYMGAVFVVLFFTLLVMRPSLVTVEVQGKEERQLSPKKVLVWSVAFSAPIIFAIYFYVCKKKPAT